MRSFQTFSSSKNCSNRCFRRMNSRYETFDRSRLRLLPLSKRVHDLSLDHWMQLEDAAPAFDHPDLPPIAARLIAARQRARARILMMGAHLLRAGVNRHL